jgi:hypothetical protein
MINKIVTPQDAIQVLNENLEGLLTGKRKVMVVKEVNNTVGKMLEVHKLEAVSKGLSRDNTALAWFSNAHAIEETRKENGSARIMLKEGSDMVVAPQLKKR